MRAMGAGRYYDGQSPCLPRTRLFGLLLIVLGLASYVTTGRTSVTALIPAFVGAVFVILAIASRAILRRAST